MNISPEKLLVIAVLALLVLGPNRLPAAARSAGRALAELRRLSSGLQGELREALAEPQEALQHAVDEFGVRDLRSAVRSPVKAIAAAVTEPLLSPPSVATTTTTPTVATTTPTAADTTATADNTGTTPTATAADTVATPAAVLSPGPLTSADPPAPDDPSLN